MVNELHPNIWHFQRSGDLWDPGGPEISTRAGDFLTLEKCHPFHQKMTQVGGGKKHSGWKTCFFFLWFFICLDLVDIFFGGIGGIWLVNLWWTLKNPRILMGAPSRRSSQKTPTSGPEIWRDESVWSDVTLIFFTAL